MSMGPNDPKNDQEAIEKTARERPIEPIVPKIYAGEAATLKEERYQAQAQREFKHAAQSMHEHATDETAAIISTPMRLFCPVCNARHIDKPEPEKGWENPPHKTHLCAECGHLWRPFEYATIGVSDEEWQEFVKSYLNSPDTGEVLSMAHEIINRPDNMLTRTLAMLEADRFVDIGCQMKLYAKLVSEPTDRYDHVRLWYVDRKGEMAQGDSIAWPTFLESVLKVIGVPQEVVTTIMDDLKANQWEHSGGGAQ